MARALITINGVTRTYYEGVVGDVIALGNDDEGGEASIQWVSLTGSQPSGSYDGFADPIAFTTALTASKEGNYLVSSVVNNDISLTASAIIAIRHQKSDLQSPAAGEKTERDSQFGWARTQQKLTKVVDDLYADAAQVTGLAREALTRGDLIRVSGSLLIKAGLPDEERIVEFSKISAEGLAIIDDAIYIVEGVGPSGSAANPASGSFFRARRSGLFGPITGSAVLGDPVYPREDGTVTASLATIVRPIGHVVSVDGTTQYYIHFDGSSRPSSFNNVNITQAEASPALLIDLDTSASAQAIVITEDAVDRTLPMVSITTDGARTGATAAGLTVTNAGDGYGLRIAQSGARNAISINVSGGNNSQAEVVTETAVARTKAMFSWTRDATATGPVLQITQPGTGAAIDIVSGDIVLGLAQKLSLSAGTYIESDITDRIKVFTNDTNIAYWDPTGIYYSRHHFPITTAAYSLGNSSNKWLGLTLSGDATVGGNVVVENSGSTPNPQLMASDINPATTGLTASEGSVMMRYNAGAGEVWVKTGSADDAWAVVSTSSAGGGDWVDGTVGAPGAKFTSDTDTGVWRPGDNEFAIAVGGQEPIRWSQSQSLFHSGSVLRPAIAAAAWPSTGFTFLSDQMLISIDGVQSGYWLAGGVFGSTNHQPIGDSIYSLGQPTLKWKVIRLSDAVECAGSGTFESIVRVGDGTVAAPGHTFIDDSDTGIFRAAEDIFAISAGGIETSRWNVAGQQLLTTGSQTLPSLGFASDPDTGMYWLSSGFMGFTSNGTVRWSMNSAGIFTSLAGVHVAASTPAAPTLSTNLDTNTGMYSDALDTWSVTCGGQQIIKWDSSLNTIISGSLTVVNTGSTSNPQLMASDINPAVTGLTASEGSVMMRYVAGAGEVYVKTGSADDAWALLGTGSAGGGGGGEWVDGTVGAPGAKFTGDTDTGVWRPGDNLLAIAAGGEEPIRWSQSQSLALDGTAARPAYSFVDDSDCGMYKSSVNQVSFAVFATQVFSYSTAGINMPDATSISFGSSGDSHLLHATDQGTDSLVLGVGSQSNALIFCRKADIAFNFAHTQQDDPTLIVQSAAQTTNEWVKLSHDQTDALISVGTGSLRIFATGSQGSFFQTTPTVIITNDDATLLSPGLHMENTAYGDTRSPSLQLRSQGTVGIGTGNKIVLGALQVEGQVGGLDGSDIRTYDKMTLWGSVSGSAHERRVVFDLNDGSVFPADTLSSSLGFSDFKWTNVFAASASFDGPLSAGAVSCNTIGTGEITCTSLTASDRMVVGAGDTSKVAYGFVGADDYGLWLNAGTVITMEANGASVHTFGQFSMSSLVAHSFAASTAAAPGIRNFSDTDTGVFFETAAVGMTAAGLETARFAPGASVISGTLSVEGQAGTPIITLVDQATIATNCDLGNSFKLDIAGNRTLGAPTNGVAGHTYIWVFVQDSTGSRTLDVTDAAFKFGAVPGDLVLSTASGSIDVMTGVYDGVSFLCTYEKGYS